MAHFKKTPKYTMLSNADKTLGVGSREMEHMERVHCLKISWSTSSFSREIKRSVPKNKKKEL